MAGGSSYEVGHNENGLLGWSPKLNWYLNMSKWEFDIGNQESLGPKLSGSLWGGFWTALNPFLDCPSPSKALKQPEQPKIQFSPPCWAIPRIYLHF